MNIIIAGSGTVGHNLAAKLSMAGHNLVLIDPDKSRLRQAEENLDIKTITGDATSIETLRSAQVVSADLVIAVTAGDAVNILVCQLADRLGARKTIARIRNSECFHDSAVLTPSDVGIDSVIYPEEELASEVFRLIDRSFANQVSSFFGQMVEVVGLVLAENSSLVGKTAAQIRKMTSVRFILLAMLRNGQVTMLKDWEGVFLAGDKIFVVALTSDLSEVVTRLGFEARKLRNIFIYGGNSVGLLLAHKLESTKIQTRIIESSSERCRVLATSLKRVLVLNGEGTDANLLQGEGIDSADVYVAVSDNEEINLLSCILAKQMGARKTIAMISKPDYMPLVDDLPIDAVISQRLATINRILQFVRQGEVVSVSEISEGAFEAIEFRVTQHSALSGVPLGGRDFNIVFPAGAVIAAVQNELGHVFLPDSETELNTGDRVVVYALSSAVESLEKIFV